MRPRSSIATLGLIVATVAGCGASGHRYPHDQRAILLQTFAAMGKDGRCILQKAEAKWPYRQFLSEAVGLGRRGRTGPQLRAIEAVCDTQRKP
jgi:hypothetical protein